MEVTDQASTNVDFHTTFPVKIMFNEVTMPSLHDPVVESGTNVVDHDTEVETSSDLLVTSFAEPSSSPRDMFAADGIGSQSQILVYQDVSSIQLLENLEQTETDLQSRGIKIHLQTGMEEKETLAEELGKSVDTGSHLLLPDQALHTDPSDMSFVMNQSEGNANIIVMEGDITEQESPVLAGSIIEVALEALTGLSTAFTALVPPELDSTAEPQCSKTRKHKNRKHKRSKSKHEQMLTRCKVCNKVFMSSLKLTNHMISHSDERPHACDLCGRVFKRIAYLRIHRRSHVMTPAFPCQYCDKSYFEMKRLRAHEKCHINPLFCETCGKTYGNKRGLEIHCRSHTNEKPYMCNTCGQGFSAKASMKKHELGHFGLKPYVCKLCNKAYTQPTNLSDHERTHLDERTFACRNCPKVFLARSSLRRHRITNHPGEEPNMGRLQPRIRSFVIDNDPAVAKPKPYKFSCVECGKVFKKEKYLDTHRKLHIVGPMTCTFCQKNFRDKRDLLNHERRHTGEKPFRCKYCGKAFITSSASLRHEKTHLGLRPYTCVTCDKGFTRSTGLRDHELIHTGKSKRFYCDNCSKVFASRSAYRTHQRLKHDFLGQIVDAPVASMEIPIETDNTINYIKIMFAETDNQPSSEVHTISLCS